MDESSLRGILKELGIKVVNKSGKWLEFRCPFAKYTHKRGVDNRPSAGAVVDEGRISSYKCHSCKKHGRISSLVRSLEFYRRTEYPGLAFDADLADAQFSFGDFEAPEEEVDELQEPLDEAAYAKLYGRAWDVPEAREYLKDRGISKNTAAYIELGFDPDEYRITFPVRHTDGRLYGFTGRSILQPEDYPYKKYPKVRDYLSLPKRHLLLGSHFVEDTLPIFVVEGLFGYAHLMEIGVDSVCNPVALLGSELTHSKANTIMTWNRLTILVPDNDDAGDTCLFGVWDDRINTFSGGGAVDVLQDHVPLIVPAWPAGKDDPDMLSVEDVGRMLAEPLHTKKLTKKPLYAKQRYA